ncbi:hypothetical protein [Winogradskyella haliclonae]|uniref:Outer membrane protein beta-barrel domain-containing protein n=1 Tax=Winogradskyella haliclonae TaxID=2048558 RepID=A0ABQ2C143_9FLAO|nr:hypothetical protein [Winogradskyella haliclonae]GGI57483.1 hypothetical protein GCM10011444_17920 [Winogradskyella haliclonae]
MTRVIFAIVLVMSYYFGFSQDDQNKTEVSVETSVFGVQVGLIGVWAHNELRLSNQVALRSELGINGVNTNTISPSIALEPRWYYNLGKRQEKGKRIDGNSGNYFSLRATYFFHDDEELNKDYTDEISVIPTWGIRRNIGKHFNYEVGAGAGLGFESKNIDIDLYVNLRFGYRF